MLGRLAPGLRTLVAVPAGLSGMALLPFLTWSALGSLIWCALLTGAGYLLESRYEEFAGILDPVARAVLATMTGLYAWRVLRTKRRR